MLFPKGAIYSRTCKHDSVVNVLHAEYSKTIFQCTYAFGGIFHPPIAPQEEEPFIPAMNGAGLSGSLTVSTRHTPLASAHISRPPVTSITVPVI